MRRKSRYIVILGCFILVLIIGFIVNRNQVTYESEISYLLRDIIVLDADGDEIEKIEFERNRKDDYILESSIVYKNNTKCSSQEYVVDEKANILSIKSTGEHSFTCNIDYIYEENIIQKEIVINETEKYVVVEEYDENGWRKQVSVYDGDNELLKYYECSFDVKSQEEKVFEYDNNGILQYYYENICTTENQPVKVLKYKKDGELVSTVIFGYVTHRDTDMVIMPEE